MTVKKDISELELETMALSGVHLGSLRSHSHPKMKPYVWSGKGFFQIIDLEKSKEGIANAIEFLVSIKMKGGIILFVGTSLASKDATKKIAEDLGMPYVVERWLGGTLTNFLTIKRRIDYLKDLENKKSLGDFEKYTKYEASKIEKKITKLRKYLNGLLNLSRLPDVVWVSSGNYDKISAVEAKKKSIPVVGIVNTNSNPALFDYPIPANDTALSSVILVLDLIREALVNVKLKSADQDNEHK